MTSASNDPAVPAADLIADFASGYDFPLDKFQHDGISALLTGRSVLVAAPTGAGKTIVGEFAAWAALRRGGKCFYTTPIKALSNQKYTDLIGRYSEDRVGLLTGDNSINGDAPLVVMTTEVLRNMLYVGSAALTGLHAVVLDEIHYLGDRQRGAVWEEVIIQLPASVQLACLSATVGNAEDFGAWLSQVRDGCDVVISEFRPVPLEHHYAINARLYPVFSSGSRKAGKAQEAKAEQGKPGASPKAKQHAAKQARGGVPNPEVLMLERQAGVSNRVSKRGRRQAPSVKLRAPRRSDLIAELARRKWLPAIYFLFSRAGCDTAVDQVITDGLTLTNPEEQAAIRALIDERLADLPIADLEALQYGRWAAALERGIAAHHAGMVGIFKETVEALFVRGLVKVCFATETLALGINMPARTVVIERLEKWNGQRHALLSPGQFTQLTGRAGRRGLDKAGHALVAYQRDIDFPTVASLVGRRTEALQSSFAPSYNMAVNLLRRHDRAQAEALLTQSFAQFQADATVSGDADRIARNTAALQGYGRNLISDVGDFGQYWALRRELSQLESAGAKDRRQRRTDAVTQGVMALREGDVIALGSTRRNPPLGVVVSRSHSSGGMPLAQVVTADRRLIRVGTREFDRAPSVLGWVALPTSGGPRQSGYRQKVVAALRDAQLLAYPEPEATPELAVNTAKQIAAVRAQLQAHPVHADPKLSEIETWARRHDDLEADTARLQRSVRKRTGSLVAQMDRVIDVLTDLDYLEGDGPSPTADGLRLARIYTDTDLVLSEALRRGLLAHLHGPDLAAIASTFVYETRVKDPPPVVLPSPAVHRAWEAIAAIHGEVVDCEEAAGLPLTRAPDPGFAAGIHAWATGAELDEAMMGPDGADALTPGDFVRATKQVIDVLGQIRDVSDGSLSTGARAAMRLLLRGVVAYSMDPTK